MDLHGHDNVTAAPEAQAPRARRVIFDDHKGNAQ